MMDIAAKYDRNTFIDFLSNNFLPQDFQQDNKNIEIGKVGSKIKTAQKLGVCPSLDLSIYEFKHESLNDPRVTLSRESFKIIEAHDTASNALAVFHNDAANWRLSLITSGYSIGKNQSQVKRDFSNPRRYSYLLGEGCKRHTPEEMLVTKGKVNTIEDLSSRFAIDVVTEKFYRELFAWYDTWAVDIVRFPAGSGKNACLPKTLDEPAKKENCRHLIRLITRLIFVWFLKQKGHLIPEWIFDKNEAAGVLRDFDSASKTSGNYYNGIIQNLFFATLNKAIAERAFAEEGAAHYGIKTYYRDHKDNPLFKIPHTEFIKKLESVPFLNGGLFECLDKRIDGEEQEYHDGFSQESGRAAFVPNCLFFGGGASSEHGGREGIIELFNRYNFTVEENTPQDIDIALDPELLGKVFENLLGTFNEETKTTARNESGSFYTPREIVDYMADVSLKEYFKGKLTSTSEPDETGLEKKLDKLFSYHETGHDFDAEQVEQLMDAINDCKILDPACGSGAFPMGILHKLTFILGKLDPENKRWKEKQLEKADSLDDPAIREKVKEDIEAAFKRHELGYGRKLYLIENCIYGVDIQPIAIQISKLRFFISLVAEQKTGGTKENNYHVIPLPNLETKFVAANTLIGVKREESGLADPDIEKLQNKLLAIRHKHFSARNAKEKTDLRKEDSKLSKELSDLLKKDGFYNSSDAAQMAAWNPYDQNASSPFFDPYWMFGVEKGFDVVIGNPPYVEHKKLKEIVSLIKNIFEVYSGTADLSIYFIEKGLKLCKAHGYVTYIITNKFFNTEYGRHVREFLLKHQFKLFVNFEQVAVFKNALVSTTIFGISVMPKIKDDFIHQQYYKLKHDEFISRFTSDCLSGFGTYKQSSLSAAEWSFSDSSELAIKEKMEFQNKHISELEGVSVFRGVTTGYNPAFLVNKSARKVLIASDAKNQELIKPMLQGRNIRKWVYKESNDYLIFSKQGINITLYPAIQKHLKQFYSDLNPRKIGETGRGRKSGTYKWYEIQDNTAYYPEFEKEKIIWGLTADKWAFAYDNKKHYLPSNGYILTSTKVPVKYLLALLNSNLLKYYFGFIGVMTAGGAYTLKYGTIQAMPVKIAKDCKPFVELVDKILAVKATDPQADTSALERQIDNLVYRLYNLSWDEVRVIEPGFSLSKAEYEGIGWVEKE